MGLAYQASPVRQKLCAAILLGLCVAMITYNHVYVVSIVLNYHACTSPGHCTSLAKNTGFHSGIHIHSVSWLAAELSCIVLLQIAIGVLQ